MEIYHHIHCSGHGHHNHVPATINNIILFCVVLNLVFVIFEAIMGVYIIVADKDEIVNDKKYVSLLI